MTSNERRPPQRSDYDALVSKLTERGWSGEDLKLFADAPSLARAPQDKVCTMVRDWFAAHLAIEDDAVQSRLLAKLIRPLVGG